MISKARKGFILMLETTSTVLLIGFFICVLLQVLFRYILQTPLTWTEEASRYLNMWSVFLGAALAVNQLAHLRVDLIDRWAKGSFGRVLSIILSCIALLSVISLFIGSSIMTISTWGVELTMIPLPQGVLYLGAAIGSFLMIIFLVWRMIYPGSGEAEKE